jgi:hypothetical protein
MIRIKLGGKPIRLMKKVCIATDLLKFEKNLELLKTWILRIHHGIVSGRVDNSIRIDHTFFHSLYASPIMSGTDTFFLLTSSTLTFPIADYEIPAISCQHHHHYLKIPK